MTQDAEKRVAAEAAALVVRSAGPGEVAVWGRVRPGDGQHRVRVTDDGREVRSLVTEPDGTFAFTLPAPPSATLRLEVRRGGAWTPVGRPARVGGG